MENHEEGPKENASEEKVELYGDPKIASYDNKVPKFLILTYIVLPIWGFISLYYFWNGSTGWFDRGYWHELQIAANTTFPIENQNMLEEERTAHEDNERPTPQLK